MQFFKNKNLINILILIVIAIVICLPMLSKHLYVYYDDGIQHIARSYGTFNAIKNDSFLGNVIPSFSNNFGYSWNLFYGSVTTFGIMLFKIITGSYISGYKFFNFVCLILSGITMYFFVKKVSDNYNIALLSGVLYMIAPYHLTDLYVRNATGEFVSFVFIPIVFSGLYSIFKGKKGDWLLSIGSVGLLFTHNITCLYTAIFAFIYILINFKELKSKDVLKKIGINIIIILMISSCYLIPMLETKMSAKYRVYEDGVMYNLDEITNQRLSIKRLFVTRAEDGFVFELGPYMIIMLAFSILTIRSIKKEYKKDYLFFLICGLLTMFMATKLFPWRIIPKFLRVIQFPWRLLEFTSFFFAIIAAINMGAVIKNFSLKDSLIIILIATIYIIALKGFVLYSTEKLNPIENIELGKITGMENECIPGMGKGEYLPKKAYDNRFYIATREDRIYATKGKAVIEKEEKNGTKLTARIKTFEEETELELPYIYYPGYEITLDGMHVTYFETENGMIGIKLSPKENTVIEVKYSGRGAVSSPIMITLVGVAVLVLYAVFVKNEEKNTDEEVVPNNK